MSILIAIVAPVQAAQVLLDADTRRLKVGQSVGLHVTVVDGSSSRPDLPEVDGLSFVPAGQQVGIQMVNFKNIKTVTYSWQLTAEREGSFGIPSVPVEVDGTTLTTNPLRLAVAARDASEGETLTARISDDDGRLWVGQTLVYDLHFSTPKRVVDRRWTPPTFDGMVSEQDTDRRVREYQASIDGVPHEMIEVSEPLVVTAAGRRTIPPSVFTVQYPIRRQRNSRDPLAGFGGFIETKTEIFTSEAIEVDVSELPTEGRIDALWTGLVGDFTLTAQLSEASVALGESATLEVVLVGDGSLAGFSLPTVEEREGYRIYDDAVELQAEVVDGAFLTKGVYRRAIVPEAVGSIELDPVALQVFDANTGTYVLLESSAQLLDVREGELSSELESYSEGTVDARRDVADLGEDILPIKTDPSTRSGLFSPWALGGIGVLPGLGLGGFLFLGWVRSRQVHDPRVELRARLVDLDDDLGRLEDVFREALGIRLGRAAAGLEKADLEGLDEGLRERCRALYGELEAARYGGGAGGLRDRVRQLCEELIA